MACLFKHLRLRLVEISEHGSAELGDAVMVTHLRWSSVAVSMLAALDLTTARKEGHLIAVWEPLSNVAHVSLDAPVAVESIPRIVLID